MEAPEHERQHLKKVATVVDVLIVGAGISGLACAYYLKQAGLSVLVLESSNRVGGFIQTEIKDGYTLEYGPNSLRGDSLPLEEIIHGVGLQGHICKPALTKTRNYIAFNGELISVPRSPIELLRTPLLSPKAKRYLLTEPFHKATNTNADESVASFFRRRVGTEAVERLIKPLMSGIYAGDAELLSIASAFPKLYEHERAHGSILMGMLTTKKKEKSTLPRMFSFEQGLTSLPNALHSFLASSILLQTPVRDITSYEGCWRTTTVDDEMIESKHVIVTTPLAISRTILGEIFPAEITDVYCPPIGIVYLGYKEEDVGAALDGFGFLVAPSEKSSILGCIYTSALFPDRSPKGHVLFTILLGGATRPDLPLRPSDELEQIAIAAFNRYIVTTSDPVFVSHHSWAHSIPQYNIGHAKLISQLSTIESTHAGLYFGGNYNGGISLGSCATHAKSIAGRVIGR